MEFLTNNYLQTTTSLTYDSNSLTVDNLLNRDYTFQYVSSGYNNDLTTTSIVINFDETLPVSRIALQGINIKEFNIFYNGSTANSFNLTSTAATTTSQWSTNSETSMFLRCSEVNATSVTFDFKSTIIANSEKAIGYIYLGDTKLVFPRIPTSKNYKPKKTTKEIVHKLSDGGTRVHVIDKKFSTSIKFKYIMESFRNSLEDIWDEKSSFWYVAFGTSTGWDNIFYKVVWPGVFDFYEYSQDSKTPNFSGSIDLREVSG